jgi:RNA polymerase sigma-70 factor (ECF subfamily)
MNSTVERDPEALLASARAGDKQALGELLGQYTHYLTLLARVQIGRRLRGKVEDVDLVQETFLEAHRHFEGFRGTTEGELVSWLRTILAARLSNLLRRYYGTQRRDVRLERELADELDQSSLTLDRCLAAVQSTPSQQAARREQAVLLANALERLPAAYREVIILSHLEGLPFSEVARRMGRTVYSVKNLWARALGRLRRSLGETP